jgi:dephospho-CoA kinase
VGVIGLTGGIATGKSAVAAMLARRGARVVDADLVAREVVEPGTPGLTAVVERFGEAVRRPDGGLDRERLGGIVFADAERRRELEGITHPLIRARMAERVAEALAAAPPLVVVDVPLLFEGQRQNEYAGVLLVYADPETQLRRLRGRDQLSDAAARQRLAAQMDIDAKRALATWVIDNSGDIEATQAAVANWWAAQVNNGIGGEDR